MTLATVAFNVSREKGNVTKVGRKARFYDGRRRVERSLYFDRSDNNYYVIYDGDAYRFYPHSVQSKYFDYWTGRI